MNMESLRCNTPCYFGLLAYAEVDGKPEPAHAGTLKPTDCARPWMLISHPNSIRGAMCGIRKKWAGGESPRPPFLGLEPHPAANSKVKDEGNHANLFSEIQRPPDRRLNTD